ncbi:MAG TPA: DUF3455 domain-containing protein [Candidatus Angelobacter sp.]|nr:DUF3455 domain-containing protein [Candidatus Angelobacter sp.]
MKNPTVPDLIAPPAGTELLLLAHARGFQVYVCRTDSSGQPAWVLKAPDALLYDEQGKVLGKHFGGPAWKHNDGSEVTAKPAAKVDAPAAGAIPWLLLNVTDHSGSGALSRVTAIQRIHTVGGLAPASGCSSAEQEEEFRSSYSADYYFYGHK